MKIALKYGLLITLVVIAWILWARYTMEMGPDSPANVIAPILFNLALLVAIFLGMRARKKELNGDLGFKEGLKTGMGISMVYAVSSCLFFMIQFFIAGPNLLLSDAAPSGRPLWQIAAIAYTGLFFGAIVAGLIFSTLIAFFLARRRHRNYTEVV